MEVLIVSKTFMGSTFCVGGLVFENDRYVRLLDQNGFNQPLYSDFEIGDIWDIDFTDRETLDPPHVEDVIVSKKTRVDRIDEMSGFLISRRVIDWHGHIDALFDGLLNWTKSGAGYIPEHGGMPAKSVGFWIADKDLFRVNFEKVRFRYPNGPDQRSVRFVGSQESVPRVAAGTVIRVSLSRIFPSQDSKITSPRGYYLQLSGWYL
jgi:hypothetical protein